MFLAKYTTYAVTCAVTPELLVHQMETMHTKSLFLPRLNQFLALEYVLVVVRVVLLSLSQGL